MHAIIAQNESNSTSIPICFINLKHVILHGNDSSLSHYHRFVGVIILLSRVQDIQYFGLLDRAAGLIITFIHRCKALAKALNAPRLNLDRPLTEIITETETAQETLDKFIQVS